MADAAQPVTSASRSLVGYLDVRSIGSATRPSATVGSAMRRFQRQRPYQGTPTRRVDDADRSVITPDTDLQTLEAFLREHDFAAVTDASRRFVLGVVTREDLSKCVCDRVAWH